MNRTQYRAGLFTDERRSLAMATALAIRAQAAKLWQEGMDFLKSIHKEEEKVLRAVWDRDEEDTKETSFGLLPIMPAAVKVDPQLIEETMADFEMDGQETKKKVSSVILANRLAKMELKELAHKH